jgi:lipopolysaccharide export system protein LptA
MTSRPSLSRLTTALAAFVISHSSFVIPSHAQPAPAPIMAQVPTELRSEKLEMTSTDDETTAVATQNVILTGTNLRITCDQLTIIATRLGDKDATVGDIEKFKYILATGNVRIIQGDRESTSQRAEVFPREDKVVLSEDPVIIDHSNGFVAAGEKITLFRGKREVFVEKPKFTGPPVGDLSATAAPKATPPASKPTAKPAPASGVTFPKPRAQ